jgi:hypothetical protein
MPKIEAAQRRDKKREKRQKGPRESGRSVFLSQAMVLRRAEKAAKQKARESNERTEDS